MTDSPNIPESPENTAALSAGDNGCDRIAKVMSRAGVASRREAERMILEGRVSVNGAVIHSPALDVRPSDKVVVDGKPLDAPQETRMWLYFKPVGLITTESDEKGRQTVFDALPRDLPRVMSVGRLDINSEGLLLLTNDGELKQRLEHPETGWLRRYRVRVLGTVQDSTFDPLREGVTIDGENFLPMEITLDHQKGMNSWVTVGLREGRNREIRRAMEHLGLRVSRLIRISYGPFKLGDLQLNEVREVRRRTLRDQLGGLLEGGRKPRHGKRADEMADGFDGRDGDSQRKPRARTGQRGAEGGRGDGRGEGRFAGKRPEREGGERRWADKGGERRFGDKPHDRRGAGEGDSGPSSRGRSFGARPSKFGGEGKASAGGFGGERRSGDRPERRGPAGAGPNKPWRGDRDNSERGGAERGGFSRGRSERDAASKRGPRKFGHGEGAARTSRDGEAPRKGGFGGKPAGRPYREARDGEGQPRQGGEAGRKFGGDRHGAGPKSGGGFKSGGGYKPGGGYKSDAPRSGGHARPDAAGKASGARAGGFERAGGAGKPSGFGKSAGAGRPDRAAAPRGASGKPGGFGKSGGFGKPSGAGKPGGCSKSGSSDPRDGQGRDGQGRGGQGRGGQGRGGAPGKGGPR